MSSRTPIADDYGSIREAMDKLNFNLDSENLPSYEEVMEHKDLYEFGTAHIKLVKDIAKKYNCREGCVSSCFFNVSWICLQEKKCKYYC